MTTIVAVKQKSPVVMFLFARRPVVATATIAVLAIRLAPVTMTNAVLAKRPVKKLVTTAIVVNVTTHPSKRCLHFLSKFCLTVDFFSKLLKYLFD